MPLFPSGFSLDDNLNVDGHNEVDAISHRCSHLLALLAWHHRITNLYYLLTGGPPLARRGDIGAVLLQDRSLLALSSPLQRMIPEAGFRGWVYGDNIIAQESSLNLSRNPKEWSHSWAMMKTKKNKILI